MPVIKKTLEKILGEERTEKLVHSWTYKFGLEMFVMNTLSYVVATPVEFLVAGMDVYEHIGTRLVSVATNTLAVRKYSKWRASKIKKWGITKKSNRFKRYLADTATFTALVPLAWVNMTIGGAELDEMIRYTIPIIAISGAMGGPHGAYLDFMLKQSGLPPEYLANESISSSHTSGRECKNK
jgi:hypothetical protein